MLMMTIALRIEHKDWCPDNYCAAVSCWGLEFCIANNDVLGKSLEKFGKTLVELRRHVILSGNLEYEGV